jgi:hypothetical protein
MIRACHPRAAARAIFACLILAPCLSISIPARAQSDIVPKEVQAVFADISDIDKLRILNPLKLSGEQLDKIIAVLKKAQTEYNSKLQEAAVPPVRNLAKEIRDTRQTMLEKHTTVPKDFDEKVKKIQSDFTKRRDAEDATTLKSVSDSIRAILKEDQIATAVSIARKFAEQDGKPTMKGADDKFFNLYVLGTFILYPRIVPLLEDMRKVADTASTASTASMATREARGTLRADNRARGRADRSSTRVASLGRIR